MSREYTIVDYVPTPTRGVSSDLRGKYKGIHTEFLNDNKLVIHRFNLFTEKSNPIQRAIRYIVSALIQFVLARKETNVDIIYSSSTPPIIGVVSCALKKRLKAPFIYNVQDVFPDSLVTSGLASKGSIPWIIGSRISNYIYKNADKIIVISESMKSNLLDKGVNDDKLIVIPNWVDTEMVKYVFPSRNPLYNTYNLSINIKYIVYAGNIGESQNIELIVAAAERLKSVSGIEFLIFGNGSRENQIREQINRLNLDNVKLYDLLPLNQIKDVYSLGYASIVACKPGVGSSALPSKTLNIMAAGIPVLASYDQDSELHKMVRESNSGLFSPPGDLEALCLNIMKLVEDEKLAETLGKNGRSFVEMHYSKQSNTEMYVDVFESVLQRSADRANREIH